MKMVGVVSVKVSDWVGLTQFPGRSVATWLSFPVFMATLSPISSQATCRPYTDSEAMVTTDLE